jgi:hypothetical protein
MPALLSLSVEPVVDSYPASTKYITHEIKPCTSIPSVNDLFNISGPYYPKASVDGNFDDSFRAVKFLLNAPPSFVADYDRIASEGHGRSLSIGSSTACRSRLSVRKHSLANVRTPRFRSKLGRDVRLFHRGAKSNPREPKTFLSALPISHQTLGAPHGCV